MLALLLFVVSFGLNTGPPPSGGDAEEFVDVGSSPQGVGDADAGIRASCPSMMGFIRIGLTSCTGDCYYGRQFCPGDPVPGQFPTCGWSPQYQYFCPNVGIFPRTFVGWNSLNCPNPLICAPVIVTPTPPTVGTPTPSPITKGPFPGMSWLGFGLIIAAILICCMICGAGVCLARRQGLVTAFNVGEEGEDGFDKLDQAAGQAQEARPLTSPMPMNQQAPSSPMPMAMQAAQAQESMPLNPQPQVQGGMSPQFQGGMSPQFQGAMSPQFQGPVAPPCNPTTPCYENPLVDCDHLPDAMTEQQFQGY